MKTSTQNTNSILKSFSTLQFISAHPSYTQEHEFSDKVILPKSLFFKIRSILYPVPLVFILRNSKFPSKSLYCGVLEFTAEENLIYVPQWIHKKLSTRLKYGNQEIRLEILQSPQIRGSVFPVLTKIELKVDQEVRSELCKKALMNYTVVTKGDTLNLFTCSNKNEVLKAVVSNILPRNRCVIKSSNFELVVVQQQQKTTTEEDERRPMIDLLRISLISKSRVIDKRKQESYTPWEHRVRPIKIEGDLVNLLPWENDEDEQENEFVQILPEIVKKEKRKKRIKVLSLAFPQVNQVDLGPFTSANEGLKSKTMSFSPVVRS